MKLPERIDPTLPAEERLKIRNKEICDKWLDWYDQDLFKIEQVTDLMKRLTLEYDLTLVSIYHILKANQQYIQFDRGWEKIKRLTEYKRLRANKTNSNKDIVDILDKERIEIEGDKPLIDNRIMNITVNVKEKSASDIRTGNRITSEPIQSPQR